MDIYDFQLRTPPRFKLCRAILFGSIVAVAGAGAGCGDRNTSAKSANSSTGNYGEENAEGNQMKLKDHLVKMTLTDQKFVDKAGMSGRAEIQASTLALEKSQNQQVRDFARMMIDDHNRANQELESIARSENLTLPSELENDHREMIEKLKESDASKFDSQYIEMMQKDHEKAVSLFTAAANDEELDMQLQQFAASILPTLEQHQNQAASLNAKQSASTQ